MKLADCGPRDEIFSFATEDGTTHYHWNVTKIIAAIFDGNLEALAYTYLDITQADYIHVCLSNGIEEDHLLRIPPERMKVPIIYAEFPPGDGEEHPSHVLLDGNHRLVQTYRDGGRKIGAAIFDHEALKPFLVDDLMRMDPAQVRDELQRHQKAKP